MMMALTVHLTAFEIVYERTEQHQKVGNLGEKHKHQVFPKFILSISTPSCCYTAKSRSTQNVIFVWLMVGK